MIIVDTDVVSELMRLEPDPVVDEWAMNAGDLQGAVSALDALTGDAAQAMAEWKAKAQSLLDARAALATLAAQA